MFRNLGFFLSTLGSVASNVFTVVLGTLNTFDGTDPKVDRVKPRVRNTIFFSLFRRCLAYNCVRTASLTSKNLITILFTEFQLRQRAIVATT